MGLIQALFIAILQGATELFPVSSLGHAVVVPALLGWHIDRHDESFLPFLVMLHLGTAIALMIFFWKDWKALLLGASGRYGAFHRRESWYILVLLIVATLPAIFIGALLEKFLRSLFGTPDMVAIFLIINGILLLVTEKIRSQKAIKGTSEDLPIASLTLTDALFIGVWQCAAFFPGISRSGSTIAAGLLRNLSHEVAARFSFLMALPVILAASAHEGIKLVHIPMSEIHWGIVGVASLVAAITALLSTAFLMKYFKDNEKWALTPFGLYCLVLGIGSFLYFKLF